MRAIFVALLLMAAGIDPVRAECATPEIVTARVAADAPDAVATLLEGEDANRFAAKLAEFVGQEIPLGGAIMVFDDPAGIRAYVVFFANGCAASHGFLPAPLVREWVGGRPS